ncbi:E3 ubiquitin-protein ligase TRIM21-like isoform X1 [Bufo gargarizans]|uniref:E3 ubiquitin-protein ligase TRIM21-like isoform X1 n=1 Tax=Bufo gargarizans TaxID=30331 RepID=UPI001CF1A4D7|nr:E3 ubiquitin-protein ligase TRIM21-like isoform X1 [Bufo gargarizans]
MADNQKLSAMNSTGDIHPEVQDHEAESKFHTVCSVTNEDASIAPFQTGEQDNSQQKEDAKSPSSFVLQEDEETQLYNKRTYLQQVAWKLFQDYEKKLQTRRFTGELHSEKLKESFHHLHQYLLKEEETRIAKQENTVETSIKDLEARVQTLLGLSSTITDFLVKLEKGHTVIQTMEHLKIVRDQLEEMSKFDVPLKSYASHFQVQEWRGIRHILKPMAKSLCFDSNSANPNLFLSQNLKQVRYTNFPQRRYTTTFFYPGLYVLGLPGFQSGQHYWEVDVGHKSNWILGIVKDTVPRKGPHNLSINNGFFVVRKQEDNVYYGCDLSTLKLMDSPMRIGVFVDVSSGHIAFSNADNTELIFVMSGCSFVGKLFPFFCPGVPVREEDLGPLSLCY